VKALRSNTVKTMTSTQLANILGYEKKEVNRKIRDMFSEKIASGIIPPAYDSQNRVSDYSLPEKESKMFVAKHDIDYLEEVIEFWIDRTTPTDRELTKIILNQEKRITALEKRKTAKRKEISVDIHLGTIDILVRSIVDNGSRNGGLIFGAIQRRAASSGVTAREVRASLKKLISLGMVEDMNMPHEENKIRYFEVK